MPICLLCLWEACGAVIGLIRVCCQILCRQMGIEGLLFAAGLGTWCLNMPDLTGKGEWMGQGGSVYLSGGGGLSTNWGIT